MVLIRRFSLGLNWQISSISNFLLSSLRSIFILNFFYYLVHNSIHHFGLHLLLPIWNRLLSRNFRRNSWLLLQLHWLLNLIILSNWLRPLNRQLILTSWLLSLIPVLIWSLILLNWFLVYLRLILILILLIKVVYLRIIIKIITLIIIKVIYISLLRLNIPLISIFRKL